MNLVTVFSALSAGMLFGLSVHLQKKGLAETGPRTGAFISIATVAVMFWALAPAMLDWSLFDTRAALIFALCGILFPAASQNLQVAALTRVGPALTSALGSFSPLFAVLPAVAFLGERLTVWDVVGIGLLTLGLLLASGALHGVKLRGSLLLLALPLGAAAVRGVVQPISKYGFQEAPSPYFATLVMVSVSAVVLTLVQVAGGWRATAPSRRALGWFVVNGVTIGVGMLALQYAIVSGDVSVAAPLAGTTPLWALALGALVFRHEALTARHGVVAVLVVVGSSLVVAL